MSNQPSAASYIAAYLLIALKYCYHKPNKMSKYPNVQFGHRPSCTVLDLTRSEFHLFHGLRAQFVDRQCISVPFFQQNLQQCEAELLMILRIFRARYSGGGVIVAPISQREKLTELHTGGHRLRHRAPKELLHFRYVASFRNHSASKTKIEAKFRTFFTREN